MLGIPTIESIKLPTDTWYLKKKNKIKKTKKTNCCFISMSVSQQKQFGLEQIIDEP